MANELTTTCTIASTQALMPLSFTATATGDAGVSTAEPNSEQRIYDLSAGLQQIGLFNDFNLFQNVGSIDIDVYAATGPTTLITTLEPERFIAIPSGDAGGSLFFTGNGARLIHVAVN